MPHSKPNRNSLTLFAGAPIPPQVSKGHCDACGRTRPGRFVMATRTRSKEPKAVFSCDLHSHTTDYVQHPETKSWRPVPQVTHKFNPTKAKAKKRTKRTKQAKKAE